MNLGNCNLNDESLKIFVKCTFPSLKQLHFNDNCYSDKCYEIICEQKLNELRLIVLSFHKYDHKFTMEIGKCRFLCLSKMNFEQLKFGFTFISRENPQKIMKNIVDFFY